MIISRGILIKLEHQLFSSDLYQEQISTMPMLKDLISRYEETKPFKDISLAFAHVMVPNILPMIVSLVIGGAEIVVTNCCLPTQDERTVKFLKSIGIEVDPELKSAVNFDYSIDCGGFFAKNPPKLASVEVTRSGVHEYNQYKDKVRVISADDSRSKLLETFFGNPRAILKGLTTLAGISKEKLRSYKIAIIGFGKIGRGLARLFSKYTEVIVIDKSKKVVEIARRLELNAVELSNYPAENSNAIQDYDIIMTATGLPNIITHHFQKKYLKDKLLINVGAVDEFGDDYSQDEVFLSKDKPFNFNLTPPTENKYIDPILYAQVEGLRYAVENEIDFGIHPLPKSIDESVIREFSRLTGEDIMDMYIYFPE